MSTNPLLAELSKPEYAALSDSDAATRLNAPVLVGRRLVPLSEFMHRLFTDAAWAALATAAASHTDAQVRAAAVTVYDYLRNPHVENIDFDLPATRQTLAALVQAGVLAAPLVAEIDHLADVTTTRARQLGFRRPLTAALVSQIRRK